jgi:hypothetical protein
VHFNEIIKKKYQKANDKNTINVNKHTPDIVLQNTRNWERILLLNTSLRINNIQSLYDILD